MFLESIELKGFKSFANKTKVKFKDGLTIIVGPNGSGKSNINDALKWVFGEISKKTLRASNSNDIIFSGSKFEAPSKFAEVTLVFNNESRIFDLEEDKVSITRKSFRDESFNEYYINSKLVRRKEIRNLLLDTGLGNTDLSIISQGSVSKITEAKPSELKKILEEASGVSKYQIQKKESLTKIDKISTDLTFLDSKLKILERQIKPLRSASEKANNYNKIKEEIKKIELPFLKETLSKNTQKLKELKEKLDSNLNKKIFIEEKNEELYTNNKNIQNEILEIEKKINSLQLKQEDLRNTINVPQNEEDIKIIENKIKEIAKNIGSLKKIITNSSEKEKVLNQKINDLKKEDYENSSIFQQLEQNLNKIKYEIINIETNSKKISFAVKKILENKNIFNIVYGVLEQIIFYDNKYELAIKSAIGGKLSNIIVNDENTVKSCINFLKTNKFGNAFFMPSESVKPKFIDEKLYKVIEKIHGFKGTLSEVIKSDLKFKNLVSSISGNILLFDNLDNAISASKFINNKLTIVTIDGDIIFPNSTFKGGYNKGDTNALRKEKLLEAQKAFETKFKDKKQVLLNIREELIKFGSERSILQNEEIRISERKNYLESQMQQLLISYENICGKKYDINIIDKFISEEKNNSLGELSLEEINNSLRNAQQRRNKISSELLEIQEQQSNFNKEIVFVLEEVSNLRMEINSIEQMIESEKEILNKDYKITLENLLNDKKIKKFIGDLKETQEKRKILREDLKNLGFIDVEAIEKFEKLNEEFQDLSVNLKNLKETKNKLSSTIKKMDKEMLLKIKETFEEVNIKFDSIFKQLFRGGEAEIKFQEPENILESGLEIIASAPGKKIKNINLYSGGEKALITLSLIFAINEVKKLPLLLLDEVEAALDEANVERFSRFAKILNETTQLLIVSHRPGTMEKADFLYGVTMQDKGVSNVFNVKLEEAIEIVE